MEKITKKLLKPVLIWCLDHEEHRNMFISYKGRLIKKSKNVFQLIETEKNKTVKPIWNYK